MTYFGGGGGVSPSGGADFTGPVSVLDGTKFKIKNQTDSTKIIQFSAASITAGQTRTITVPDSNTTLPIASQVITFAGPTAARTYTLPDSAQTLGALGAAGQTWTQVNSYNGGGGAITVQTDSSINFGNTVSTIYAGMGWLGGQTPNTFGIFTGSTSNNILIAERADGGFDFAHALATDPTVFIHSHNQSTTQWIGLTHDGTDGVVSTGTGALSIASASGVKLVRTITAAGTTGAQTINKMAGTVNFAAGASAITVTNSLVDANSIILGVIRTADATATFIKSIVPGSGSFVITLNATATAETSVGFVVTN